MVDSRRVRTCNDRPVGNGPVVYWMQRDQRAEDSWALLYAQERALARQVPLMVVFNLVPRFGDTTLRHYDFMFTGLQEVEAALRSLNIPFILLQGQPHETLGEFVQQQAIGEVVTDFNPLRFTQEWRALVSTKLPILLSEVDAHNIVPCWHASDKLEFAAHTFRPKVHRLLKEFLTDIPPLQVHPYTSATAPTRIDWQQLLQTVVTDATVVPAQWLQAGSAAGLSRLHTFIETQLDHYAQWRNDPNQSVISNLSPYLHFGQVSAQRVAYEVNQATHCDQDGREAYLEELIVRRELADNYCLYNPEYDQVSGAHAWAQKTIADHAADEREYIYTKDELESAKTHDELWNAMQWQMVKEGKMHGWCRMYWAKKILEWTPDAQSAIDTALYLNDKYELDGTDPNGIVGVMWSICGVHDRAWGERSVFGKIRYMNFAGAKRKFNIAQYIDTYTPTETLFHE